MFFTDPHRSLYNCGRITKSSIPMETSCTEPLIVAKMSLIICCYVAVISLFRPLLSRCYCPLFLWEKQVKSIGWADELQKTLRQEQRRPRFSEGRLLRRGGGPLLAAQFRRVVAARQEGLDVARRLAQPLPVLDQRDADKALAVFAEADTRRHRDIGPLQQQLVEGETADAAVFGRHRRPGKHRGGRRRHFPAGLPEPVEQHVAPRPIALADFGNAVLRPVQRRGCRHLDR